MVIDLTRFPVYADRTIKKVAEAAQKRSSAWRPDYRPGHDQDPSDRNLAPGLRLRRFKVNQGGANGLLRFPIS